MTATRHVMISGGAGFIGSHLCDHFLGLGYAVTAIDNFCTGREANLAQALKHPDFQLIRADVSEPLPNDVLRLADRYGLEGVLHFACPASPVDFESLALEILKVDSIGTIQLVDLAQKYGSRFIVASTSEVYGDPLVHPQVEEYWGNVNPIGPRACYDETKRFSEAYVSTFARVHPGFKGGIVRIFNTYGPRMRLDDGRVVPELCRQALLGKPLTVHGTGEQTRSFCYVSDLVAGIGKYYASNLKQPVNLGNPHEITVAEFARTILKIIGSASSAFSSQPLQYGPDRPDDPKKRRPDITKARQLLQWEPKIDLDAGLKETIASFRQDPALRQNN